MSSHKKRPCLNSVTKKQVMGITGLLLSGFLISHLLGNVLIFVGPDAFNKYSYTLTSNPLIYAAELILGSIAVAHILMAIKLVRENRAARPDGYFMRKHSGRGATLASATMQYSGLVALVFIVLHIMNLKFGTHYDTTVNGVVMRDMYRTTIEYMANPLHLLWYIVAVSVLGLHVSHGFWSAFQSIGLNHPKYMPKIQCLSKLFGILVAVGFSVIAIYCFIQGAK